ncbi:MAG: prepilin peptidase [Eggerthellaceae bacterium]|nr:prepilin peptidase [Eggerthellaceae bacterium]
MTHTGSANSLMPQVRIIMALAFLLALCLIVVYGLTFETVQLIAMLALLAYVSWNDLRTRMVPNRCIVAAVAVRFAYFAGVALIGRLSLGELGYYVASGLGIGVAMLVFALVFEYVTGREGMGGGDVKLYALAGLYLGVGPASMVIFLSCVFALLMNAFGIIGDRGIEQEASDSHQERLTQAMPFAPAISLAFALVMLALPMI